MVILHLQYIRTNEFLDLVGRSFWVYDGSNFIENSPRPLTDYGLPDYVNSVDAVQIWGKNGNHIYSFSSWEMRFFNFKEKLTFTKTSVFGDTMKPRN